MLHTLEDKITIEVMCADPVALLSRCNQRGIILQRVAYKDNLTVVLTLERKDLAAIRKTAEKCGAEMKVKYSNGIYWTVSKWLNRPVFVLGICLILALTLLLPTRILFVFVEGNTTVSTEYILEQADSCGITFGASRRKIRSEQVKNQLLSAIPELQWAGVNTYGCTAVISVRERTASEIKNPFTGVSSMIAVRDGIIESCTAVSGNMLCKVGQAVNKGDVLISGFTDVGLWEKGTKAEGEVFAQTKRSLTVVMPVTSEKKEEIIETHKRFGFLIGKKRIYLLKDSGIWDTSCDKIYKEHFLTLPGGFTLPFGWFEHTITLHNSQTNETACELDIATLQNTGRKYLLSMMVSGRILHERSVISQAGDMRVLTADYICSEMIGRFQQEENLQYYGEDNGKNR